MFCEWIIDRKHKNSKTDSYFQKSTQKTTKKLHRFHEHVYAAPVLIVWNQYMVCVYTFTSKPLYPNIDSLGKQKHCTLVLISVPL